MNDPCLSIRSEWPSAPQAALEHARQCAECARWLHARELQVRALNTLGRAGAPRELEQRVASELTGDRTRRLVRTLSSLARLGAPAELDEAVLGSLGVGRGDEERGRQKSEVLRALDVHAAPGVLERLLEEELQAPERHRIERFTGSMPRLQAPSELERRLGTEARRRRLLRLAFGPLATLAAAGLVVWIALRQPEPEVRRYRFQVLQASSAAELEPMARLLAEGLNGGPLSSGEAR